MYVLCYLKKDTCKRKKDDGATPLFQVGQTGHTCKCIEIPENNANVNEHTISTPLFHSVHKSYAAANIVILERQ